MGANIIEFVYFKKLNFSKVSNFGKVDGER